MVLVRQFLIPWFWSVVMYPKVFIHALSWLVHGISPTVFDPMVLVCGIASKSVDLTHFHDWYMVLVQQFLM